jgi:hypothetical protein
MQGTRGADLSVSVKQLYTLPSQLNSTVSSLVFPGTDRLKDAWASETASNYVRHGAAAIAAAQAGGAGVAAPRDIPDYAGAAEYAKRNFVKLGYDAAEPGSTENKAAFPLYEASLYANPRAAKVSPPKGTGLYFGSEPADFTTDSRANFLAPTGAQRGPNAAERRAVNLCVSPWGIALGGTCPPRLTLGGAVAGRRPSCSRSLAQWAKQPLGLSLNAMHTPPSPPLPYPPHTLTPPQRHQCGQVHAGRGGGAWRGL